MHFAFCLYKHFPYSGLSRDMLRIMAECLRRGHQVTIFVGHWQGEYPTDVEVVEISHFGLTNHTRASAFHRKLYKRLQGHQFDALVGFNKIPGMDMYFCGDYCFVGRAYQKHSIYYRKTPRYLFFRSFEHGVFSTNSNTRILSLSDREKSIYQQYYLTQDDRFYDLPPTLDKHRRTIQEALPERHVIRAKLGIQDNQLLVLLVGSGFKTKGLDRAIKALASLPDEIGQRTSMFVVGQDRSEQFRLLAKRLGVSEQVRFLGGRDDIPELMKAGDLLLHPAYAETAGTVLLEAITSGLPVLATKVCGYAPHIGLSGAGQVLRSPFCQEELDDKLAEMLVSPERKTWVENGLEYGRNDNLYVMPEYVAELLETIVGEKTQASTPYDEEQLYLRKDFADSLQGQPTFDELMEIQGEIYREAPGRKTLRFARGDKEYFLKTHTGVGWNEIIKNLSYFRAPVVGALNEWHGVHRLTDLEIDTMTVVGYGLRGKNPARRRSFIITEALPTSTSLEDFTQDWQHNPPRSSKDIVFKRRLINKIAEITRTMHENGANHRDYYLCHFLLDIPDQDYHQARLYLIDLHRMQLRRKTPLRWKIKDVAGLYYSSMDIGLTQRDLFRFMVAYRGKPLRQVLAETNFWARVARRGKNLYRSEKSKQKKQLARNRELGTGLIGK